MTTLAQASLTLQTARSLPPRFAPGLSTTHGGIATGDPGVSPDRTHTARPPRTCRSHVMSPSVSSRRQNSPGAPVHCVSRPPARRVPALCLNATSAMTDRLDPARRAQRGIELIAARRVRGEAGCAYLEPRAPLAAGRDRLDADHDAVARESLPAARAYAGADTGGSGNRARSVPPAAGRRGVPAPLRPAGAR